MTAKNLNLKVLLPFLSLALAVSGCVMHPSGNALQRAAGKGQTDMVLTLLKKNPDSEEINLALIQASIFGKDGAVKALLDAGADVNYGEGQALADAALFNHPSTVKLLLSRGADAEAPMQMLARSLSTAGIGTRGGIDLIRRFTVKYSMISIPDTEENRDKAQKCQQVNNPEYNAKEFLNCIGFLPGFSKKTTSVKSQESSPGCSWTETHFTVGNDDYTVQFCPVQE